MSTHSARKSRDRKHSAKKPKRERPPQMKRGLPTSLSSKALIEECKEESLSDLTTPKPLVSHSSVPDTMDAFAVRPNTELNPTNDPPAHNAYERPNNNFIPPKKKLPTGLDRNMAGARIVKIKMPKQEQVPAIQTPQKSRRGLVSTKKLHIGTWMLNQPSQNASPMNINEEMQSSPKTPAKPAVMEAQPYSAIAVKLKYQSSEKQVRRPDRDKHEMLSAIR